MTTLTLDINDNIAIALAVGRGWKPFIEDTTQELDGDSYPMIPNPITLEQYVAGIVGGFMTEYVLNEGRKHLIDEFKSIFNTIESQIKSGVFDQLILANDIDKIKTLVKSSL